MKKLFYFFVFLTVIIFVGSINIFLKINSNLNHIIGIDINLIIYLITTLICIYTSNKIFKKANLNKVKYYRRGIKITFANSFFATSIISMISACITYGFLEKILKNFNLGAGLINYTIFASKIWFISSPFIGLEVTVFRYFYEIGYFKTPIKYLIWKLMLFFIVSFLFYQERKLNCFIYSKAICDIFFLFLYSKICFEATIYI